LDAAIDRGDEFARNDAAHDLVLEPVSLAPLRRLDADPAVAELSATARLLLVSPLALRGRGERLAIGDLRPGELHSDTVLALELGHRDLEVALAHPGDHRLVRLGDVARLERRILVVQPVK